jgi:hypothetical protein
MRKGSMMATSVPSVSLEMHGPSAHQNLGCMCDPYTVAIGHNLSQGRIIVARKPGLLSAAQSLDAHP